MNYKNYDPEFMRKFDTLFMNMTVRAILTIGHRQNGCQSDISYDTRATFSHITKNVLPRLRELALITERKSGKKVIVSLTEKGRQVFKRLDEITNIIGE